MNIFKKLFEPQKPDLLYAAYKILPEEKLIVEVYEGNLTLDSAIQYKLKMAKDPMFKLSYSMFSDMRNCEMAFNGSDFDRYIAFIEQNKQVQLDKGKQVGLFSSASYLMMMSAFREKYAFDGENQGMFITMNEALCWLNRRELKPLLETTFKELSNRLEPYGGAGKL